MKNGCISQSLLVQQTQNGQKPQFNPSSDITFLDVRNLNRKQNLAHKILENHFRNDVSYPSLMMISKKPGLGEKVGGGGEWSRGIRYYIQN